MYKSGIACDPETRQPVERSLDNGHRAREDPEGLLRLRGQQVRLARRQKSHGRGQPKEANYYYSDVILVPSWMTINLFVQ